MSRYRKLTTACLAAALALGLAACGSSGSNNQTGNDGNGGNGGGGTGSKTALSYATDLNTSVATMGTLSGAVTADGSALKMAKAAADKLGVLGSDGNSAAEQTNAQAVLDAHKDLDDAVADATAKKMAAEEAKAGTSDADVIAALDAAINAATTAITDAQEVLDAEGAGSLADFVEDVTGSNQKKLKTAADKGEAVANALDTMLAAATHGAEMPPTTTKAANKYMTDDAKGMTWAEIVGKANVTVKRLGTIDPSDGSHTPGNGSLSVASITGMTAATVMPASTPTSGTDGTAYDNDNNSNYKGVPGVVFCLGTGGCKVTDGKLGAGWYFSPNSPTANYTMGSDGEYDPETLYASYGHWLTGTAVTTYATSSATNTGSWAHHSGSTVLKDSSATYSGNAAGRSVHKTLGADGDVEGIESGRFTADVELTAIFAGATSSISGEVSNFVGTDNPDAVDSSWKVKLESAITAEGAAFTNGVASDDTGRATKGAGGTWSATSYGSSIGTQTNADATRPTGIYGGFNASFTDGRVVGAYATRKSE